jgi:hypothetical protein
MNLERPIKLLLLLLVVGVWALLVRSFFPPASRQIYVCSMDDKGKISFDNSDGTIGFTGTGLQSALNEAARKGIKIHSVVAPQSGGYVVFVEK